MCNTCPKPAKTLPVQYSVYTVIMITSHLFLLFLSCWNSLCGLVTLACTPFTDKLQVKLALNALQCFFLPGGHLFSSEMNRGTYALGADIFTALLRQCIQA